MPHTKHCSLTTSAAGGKQIDHVETSVGAIPTALGGDHAALIALLDAVKRYVIEQPHVRRIEIEISDIKP
jgi:hypothetical protein